MKHINIIQNIKNALMRNIASKRKTQYNFHVYFHVCTARCTYNPFIHTGAIFFKSNINPAPHKKNP